MKNGRMALLLLILTLGAGIKIYVEYPTKQAVTFYDDAPPQPR